MGLCMSVIHTTIVYRSLPDFVLCDIYNCYVPYLVHTCILCCYGNSRFIILWQKISKVALTFMISCALISSNLTTNCLVTHRAQPVKI